MAEGKVASLFVEFRATVNKFAGDMAAISREVRAFDRILYPISQRANTIGIALSAGLTAPILAAGALVLKTGMDFETAFAGVRKTVQASEAELAALRGELIKLSTAAPVSAVEFANIAQAAGELGVKTPEIARFAQTVAELKAATRLTADEAANFLGRFTNITNLDPNKIHNLASTLVALGHGFAASESEIAAFGLRIAGAGRVVGLTDSEILAFATTLASVGLSAESGGTAISRVLKEIDKAVKGDEVRLAQFASVARQSADDFAESFKTKPAEATLRFIEGLKKMEEEGKNVYGTLESLKLQNIRVSDVLIRSAFATDELARSMSVGSNEFVKNGELTRAYGERNKTTASQIKILRDQVEALGISLFDTLAPAINNTVIPAMKKLVEEGIKPVVDGFAKLPESSQNFILGMIGLAAAAGPALLILTKLTSFIGGLGIILGRPITILATLAGIFYEIRAAAVLAVEALSVTAAGGIGAFIAALALPLKVPWWLTAAFYGELIIKVYELATAYSDLVDAQEGLNRATAGADNAVFRAISDFQKRGIDIPLADSAGNAKSVEQLRNQVTQLGLAQQAAAKSSERVAVLQQEAAKATEIHGAASQKTAEQIKAEADAADKLRKELEKIREKFVEDVAPADALNKELSYLQKYFSESDLIAVYGKRIVDAAEAQWAHGRSVSGTVGVLYEQSKAIELGNDLLKERLKDLQNLNQPVETIQAIPAEFIGPTLPANPIKDSVLKNMEEARKQIKDLGQALEDLNFLTPAQQIDQFGDKLEAAAKFAYAFNISLPSSRLLLLAQKQAAEQAAAGLKTWQDAADQGGKRITDMAGEIEGATQSVEKLDELGLADADILDILGDVIEKAGKNAKILHTELQPLIDRLVKLQAAMKDSSKEATNFQKELNKLTVKIVSDLANGIADALLSGKSLADVGAKVGKDFAAAFIKVAIEQLAAKLIKFLEDNPIVAAIATAVIVVIDIVKILGNTHLFANQFVKDIQNPLGKSLTTLVDGANKLYAVGRQTYQGAQEAETKVEEMWQSFLDDTAEFAKQGRKQATVAQQAIESLTPTFTRVINGIQQQIEQLKPPSVRAIEFTQGLQKYREGIAALTEERVAELNAEASAIDESIQSTMAQIAAQEEVGGSTKELNAQLQNLIYMWDNVQSALHPVIPELYDFAQAVGAVSGKLVPDKTEAFLDSVLNATAGAANLEEALGILETIHTPVKIIIDRLGGDIQDFANVLELSGLPIPDLIAKYLKLTNASKNATESIPKIAKSFETLVGDFVNKVRGITGEGDFAKSFLDALTTYLLPKPTAANPIKDAVDKLTVVAQNILETLMGMGRAASADIKGPTSQSVIPGFESQIFAAVPVPVMTQIMINIEDNGVVTNQFTFTDAIGRAEVRGSVIPEITEALNNNTNSTREKWIKILGGAWNGVVTQ